MSNKITHIFEPTSCISMDKLLKYQEGQLNEQENHHIEKHLSDCGFCADALEGFALVGNSSEVKNIVFGLNAQIHNTLQSPKSLFRKIVTSSSFSIAASIALVISFFFGIQQIYFNQQAKQNLAFKTETASKKENETKNNEERKAKEVLKEASELEKRLSETEITTKNKLPRKRSVVTAPSLEKNDDAEETTVSPILTNRNEIIAAADDENTELAEEEAADLDDVFGASSSDLLADKIADTSKKDIFTNVLTATEERTLKDSIENTGFSDLQNVESDNAISYDSYVGKNRKSPVRTKKAIKGNSAQKKEKKKPENSYETALDSYKNKDYNTAIKNLRKELKINPTATKTNTLLGLCLLKSRNIEEAKQQFQLLARRETQVEQTNNIIVNTQEILDLIAKNKTKKAIKILEKALLN